MTFWNNAHSEREELQRNSRSSDSFSDFETPSSWKFDKELAEKISTYALGVLDIGVFATSAYFLVDTARSSCDIKKLSVYALINGGSIPPLFFMFLSPKIRNKINTFVSAWSYETLLLFTQLYLNLVPEDEMKLYATPFIWGLSALQIKDLLTLALMKQPDLLLSDSAPITNDSLIPLMGLKTRDRKYKYWLGAMVTSGVGLTILNFKLVDQYPSFGDYGKIGIYQDLISMFTGKAVGTVLAKVFDDYKEKKESEYIQNSVITDEIPLSIKSLRFAKKSIFLFTPTAIGALLSFNHPNSLEDYISKFAVGLLYGMDIFFAQREYENPQSNLHSIHYPINPIIQTEETQTVSTCQKIKKVAAKYVPSLTFFGGLTAFMGAVAATNIPRVGYAVGTLLSTTFLSFILTNWLVVHSKPTENRLHNELNFTMIYASVVTPILCQYLLVKLAIGDENLDVDSVALYALSLIAWFFWGINVGNNRALQIQDPPLPLLPTGTKHRITSPLTMQELSKTAATNLFF